MSDYVGLIISGALLILSGLFMWKLWPVIKESWIYEKAKQFVDEMEETFGPGTGSIKFDAAVELLQAWLDKRGWKVDISIIQRMITAAVGAMHTQQGEKKTEKLDDEKVNEKLATLGVTVPKTGE